MDAIIDAGKRDIFLQGPTPISYYTNTVWVHTHDSLQDLPSLSALANRRAGFVDGYNYTVGDLSLYGIEIDYSADEGTLLRKLDAVRVDFAISDYVSTKHRLKKSPLSIRPLRPFPAVNPLFLSFHKSLTKEHHLFEEAFKQMREDGTMDAVYKAHIGETLQDLIRSF